MKNTKTIIILNCVLLLIALYTFRSIYKPSILHFNDSDVNLKYGVKGGVTFFQLFQLFPHYLNLAIFYVLNTVYIIRSFRKKHRKGNYNSNNFFSAYVEYVWLERKCNKKSISN